MEVFIPDRETDKVFVLIAKPSELGICGRDAAYLASVEPYGSADPCIRANYQVEFRYMVTPEKRAAVASLVGLRDW